MNENISSRKTTDKVLVIVLSVAAIAAFSVSMTSMMAVAENDAEANTPPADTFDTFIEMPKIQGSIDLREILTSTVKTEFSEAANSAASAVSDGMVVNGRLGVYQGYYVYTFEVLDSDNKVHHVIVDAGNGEVLHTSEGFDMGIAALGIHDGMWFGMHGPAMPMGGNAVFMQSEPIVIKK
jgi:uncharacterized membrane protein YkoI